VSKIRSLSTGGSPAPSYKSVPFSQLPAVCGRFRPGFSVVTDEYLRKRRAAR